MLNLSNMLKTTWVSVSIIQRKDNLLELIKFLLRWALDLFENWKNLFGRASFVSPLQRGRSIVWGRGASLRQRSRDLLRIWASLHLGELNIVLGLRLELRHNSVLVFESFLLISSIIWGSMHPKLYVETEPTERSRISLSIAL